MKKAREAIAKIEDNLAHTIPEAALKRDLNKMVLALSEGMTDLVSVAKEMAEALDHLQGMNYMGPSASQREEKKVLLEETKVAEKAPAKKPAAKKATTRVQKQPIAPK